MVEPVHVAVAILRRADGDVLVAERPAWRHEGGGLEFPGGKLDPHESVADALARELDEELGVRLERWQPLLRIRHRYPDRAVVLHVGLVEGWHGEPRGAEGQAVGWHAPATLQPERFPAANRPILAALRWPARYLVTPPVPEAGIASVVNGLGRAIDQGHGLIQLRAPDWGRAAWRELLGAACGLAADAPHEVRLLVNTSDPRWLDRFPRLAGIHLGARLLGRFRDRPIPLDRILSCACHDDGDLRQAERLGADLALVGHVKATPTHPAQPPLGWTGLEALVARTALPVYAIGGLTADDLAAAREHGAVGIAAIRGFWPEA